MGWHVLPEFKGMHRLRIWRTVHLSEILASNTQKSPGFPGPFSFIVYKAEKFLLIRYYKVAVLAFTLPQPRLALRLG